MISSISVLFLFNIYFPLHLNSNQVSGRAPLRRSWFCAYYSNISYSLRIFNIKYYTAYILLFYYRSVIKYNVIKKLRVKVHIEKPNKVDYENIYYTRVHYCYCNNYIYRHYFSIFKYCKCKNVYWVIFHYLWFRFFIHKNVQFDIYVLKCNNV